MESKEAEGIMNRIFAGIVSFEPDIERLRCNIDAIAPQVCAVVIFDNGSSNYREIRKSIKNAVLIRSEKNLGIAAALNRLIRWGERKGYKWMISLDQDSVCPTDYVKDMLPLLDLKRVGIAAPVIIDRSIGVVGHSPKGSYAEVRTCITSGAFNSIAAWCKVGGYDESMFIDSVDFEYCYRLRKHGYRVVQSGKVWLLHEVGKSQKRRFLIWKVTVNCHSAFRKYYIARNNIYYPLKHRLWLHLARGNMRNLWLIIAVLLYENNKSEKLKEILRGWKDGIKGSAGKLFPNLTELRQRPKI